MATALRARLDLGAVAQLQSAPAALTIAQRRGAVRIATIDWMRGLVMLLMVIDHASMAFDGSHLSEDSAMYPSGISSPASAIALM